MTACLLMACLAGPPPAAEATASTGVERGQYLVHRVAMCIVCHSPRDPDGNVLEGRLLTGGRIPVASPYPQTEWAFEAPRLAGLPGWEDDVVTSILTTGRRPDGYDPKSPMPEFRLSQADAAAVVAYLKSLR
jgi:mono/diheme cytochrome c family protein